MSLENRWGPDSRPVGSAAGGVKEEHCGTQRSEPGAETRLEGKGEARHGRAPG